MSTRLDAALESLRRRETTLRRLATSSEKKEESTDDEYIAGLYHGKACAYSIAADLILSEIEKLAYLIREGLSS
jgi:hypothetical protein